MRPSRLYHGTDQDSLDRILKYNVLECRSTHYHSQFQRVNGISCSRCPRIARTFGEYVLELDLDRLRERHRIEPVQFQNAGMIAARTSITTRSGRATEAEEFIYGSVFNLKRYLVTIHYDDMSFVQPTGIRLRDQRFQGIDCSAKP